MNRTVIILGAGSSVEAGAPLMSSFVSEIRTLRSSSNDSRVSEAFALFLRGWNALQSASSKSNIHLYNIEKILIAFEMAELLGDGLGDLEPSDVSRLRDAAITSIAYTIEEKLRFPVHQTSIRPTQQHAKLVEHVIRPLLERQRRVSVITFNYDFALEHALFCEDIVYEYHLDTLSYMHKNAIPKDYTYRLPLDQTNCPKCQGRNKFEPFIVPPTWNKSMSYTQLRHVWKAAARHLREADNIVVIGYSWPDTDQLFPYLYALGTVQADPLENFMVVDTSQAVLDRYRDNLLGEAAREKFTPIQWRFSEGISVIKTRLGLNN